LVSIIHTVNQGGFIITLILAIVAGLVIFNTIRLAIYSNRDEISIMRLVGASNTFVRGPYVVGGILAGLISALISIIIALPLVYFVSPYLKIFIPNLNFFSYFVSNIFLLTFYQIIFGVLIGAFSSFVAVRRYLKN
jgi:cell division transport system permease protein